MSEKTEIHLKEAVAEASHIDLALPWKDVKPGPDPSNKVGWKRPVGKAGLVRLYLFFNVRKWRRARRLGYSPSLAGTSL